MKTKNRLFAMLIALILMAGLFPVQAKAEKNKLTVTAIDQTYTYNGWIQGEGDTIYAVPAQIAQKVQVDGLKDGDYIYLVELFGQGTDAGEYEVAVNRCVVRNSATNDNVTENYDIELVDGKMTIEPATLTVTTGSASKVYDGTPLEEETATIEGFIRNDTATVKATGSRTDAGTSDNTYEIEWGETKASNYKIVEKLGTLTVTPAEASITVDSASKMQGEADPDFTGSVEGLVAEGDSYTVNGDHTFTAQRKKNSTTPGTSDPGKTSPKTGDESNLALWSSLMFLSLAGMLVVAVGAKRRRKTR